VYNYSALATTTSIDYINITNYYTYNTKQLSYIEAALVKSKGPKAIAGPTIIYIDTDSYIFIKALLDTISIYTKDYSNPATT